MFASVFVFFDNFGDLTLEAHSLSFEGVGVTTVILAPGACGGGLRGALPDAISVSPVVPAVPLVNSQNADLMRRHRT